MEQKTKGPSSYIYLVECLGPDNFYKIGFATNPQQRLKELQIGCPYELKIILEFPGGLIKEKELHAFYNNSYVRGEWFNLNPLSVELLKMTALLEWAPYSDWILELCLKEENPQSTIQMIHDCYENGGKFARKLMDVLEPMMEAHDR